MWRPLIRLGLLSNRTETRPQPSAGASTQASVSPTESPLRSFAIIASALRLPHGSTAGEVLLAVKENKAHPDLDPELRDDDGFPLMTSRCASADDEVTRSELACWLSAANTTLTGEQRRALVLATQTVRDIVASSPVAEKLLLAAMIPEDWLPGQSAAANGWLVQTIRQSGWPDTQVHVVVAGTLDSALTAVEQSAGVALVVAFASNVGDETVAQWRSSGTLFTTSHQQGLIPGEGAAALLLRVSPQVDAPALASYAEGRLDVPADARKRTDTRLLRELASQVISASSIEAGRIAAVVADTGHRTNRVLELANVATALAPEIDGSDDVQRITAAAGTCGPVASLAALVLAQQQAIANKAPVLWISNEHAYLRGAAIILPPTDLVRT